MSRWKPLPSQELLNSLFEYDPLTGVLQRKNGRICNPKHRVRINGKSQYRLHRVIWKMMKGYDPIDVDHRDGDPSNNIFTNLREATIPQNNINRGLKSTNKTGVKGVWKTRSGTYRASICIEGIRQNLGNHPTLQLAEQARVQAEEKVHGSWRRGFTEHQN